MYRSQRLIAVDVENVRDLFRGMRAGDYFRFGEVTVSRVFRLVVDFHQMARGQNRRVVVDVFEEYSGRGD